MTPMRSSLPLSSLLSFALVAFTIEFDNEAEHRLPHITTDHGGGRGGTLRGPWLVSLVMWINCVRHLEQGSLTARDLVRRARTKTNFQGMRRWGYIAIAPDPGDTRPKPPKADWLVTLTPAGRKAYAIWKPLLKVIEDRWQKRFGPEAIERLRESLAAILSGIDPGFPDCMPILGYGLFSRVSKLSASRSDAAADGKHIPLSALLSRVLLAFAVEFERQSLLSLAICANLLRVLTETGTRTRDLPLLSGVSKESIAMGMGILRKSGLALEEKDPSGSPWKIVRLTPKGVAERQAGLRRIAEIETRWQSRFGAEPIRRLRESLEELAADGTAAHSPLFEGLEPYPDGWRAAVRKPSTLPHYPMVLHRGGYPDGS
jgi:DNA-binding MarR family transcriptional regulator